MAVNTVNLTPDPKILVTITKSPLPTINALCELIDNSIDGFKRAEKSGEKIETPIIRITLPTIGELDEGVGKLVIEDNGPGLSLKDAQNAVRAGYSGNKNPLDTLGLFGLGFNIATGKLGRRTVFTTSQKGDRSAVSIIIDLDEMVKSGTFNVPIEYKNKTNASQSFTKIEILEWWPKGDSNHEFIRKLRQMGAPKIREQLGRIYYSLEDEDFIILVNGSSCPYFHHCVWSDKRFVVRFNDKIPAKINFDHVIGTDIHCSKCWFLMETGENICPSCKAKNSARSVDRKVTGWVGIQRFDDNNRYGIDLIRNGRTIRISEKSGFFTWTDPTKNETILDYPIDNTFGRIVGEVHIDHVPVDYLKIDFQRNTSEWDEIVNFLRGRTSLQPTRAKEIGIKNDSPIYKLFQGYRSVRDVGTKDLYMGYWDSTDGKPHRISRDIEKEYYEKFLLRQAGYFDDTKWYELVEQAEERPIEGLKECPECKTQNPESAERCVSCDYIFIAKNCLNKICAKSIPLSASKCPYCGTEQINDQEMWTCLNCEFRNNPPEEKECLKCHKPRGSVSTLDLDKLTENSNKDDDLSFDNFSLALPEEGSFTTKVTTYILKGGYRLELEGKRIPVHTVINTNEILVFFDLTHPGLSSFQVRPEDYIAMEVASVIQSYNNTKINEQNRPLWSLSSLYYSIHSSIWRKRIELNPQETVQRINEFLSILFDNLPYLLSEFSEVIYEDFDDRDKGLVQQSVFNATGQLTDFTSLIKSGEYLKYIPENLIPKLIKDYPDNFFDGNFWSDPYSKISIPDAKIAEEVKQTTIFKYAVDIEDMINYKNFRNPEANYTQKINQTLKIVRKNLSQLNQ